MSVTAWQHGLRLMAGLGVMSLVACATITQSASASHRRPPKSVAVSHQNDKVATSGQWTLVWRDDFNGPAGRGINQKFWEYDIGRGVFGTNEVETMTRSTRNVHLDGHGDLDITALGEGLMWTSGRIQTRGFTFDAPTGGMLKITASLKQPNPSDGLGYWPVFWIIGPGRWPGTGEMDIMEDVNALSKHSASFHCGNLRHRDQDGRWGPCHERAGLSSGLLPCIGCQTGFHTYSLIIDRTNPANEHIRWYLDGRQFHSVGERRVGKSVWTQAVDHGFSIIFDLAMGGSYANDICECNSLAGPTSSSGTLSIRYVAVYSRLDTG
jgi:beta-glucanase (GH16 family)